MRVTLSDEEYTPSPQEMVEEFCWESNAERQVEILYSLALICKYNYPDFCEQMSLVGEQLNDLDDEKTDILLNVINLIRQYTRIHSAR